MFDAEIYDSNFLRMLRDFQVLISVGSWSAAARSLGKSRQAVKHSVESLEKILATALLEKDTERIIPTSDGTNFLHESQHIMDSIEGMIGGMKSKSEPEGLLTIAVSTSLDCRWLHKTIAAFAERYPNVELRIAFSQIDCMNLLQEHQADAALMIVPDYINLGIFREDRRDEEKFISLGTVDWVLSLPISERPQNGWTRESLKNMRFCVPFEVPALQNIQNRQHWMLSKLNFEPATVILFSNGNSCWNAAENLGYAAIGTSFNDLGPNREAYCLRNYLSPAKLAVVLRKDFRISPLCNSFVEICREIFLTAALKTEGRYPDWQ